MPYCANCNSTRPNPEIMGRIRATGAPLCCQAPPPIIGEADTERNSRLDAERVTWEFRQKSTRRLDTGRAPITESPLFGGPAQEELFA